MHHTEPLKLVSFEAEARTVLERAKAVAQEIVRRAAEEAKALRERARQEGFEAGRLEGRERGAEEERRRVAAETAGLAELLKRIAEGIEAKRRGLAASAEQDLVRLAVTIAGKIVRREVALGTPAALENVLRAVSLMADRRTLEVLLHPQDLAVVEAYVPELRRDHPDVVDLRLTADPSVERGGCLVVAREGAVDAQVETLLAEIERQMLGSTQR